MQDADEEAQGASGVDGHRARDASHASESASPAGDAYQVFVESSSSRLVELLREAGLETTRRVAVEVFPERPSLRAAFEADDLHQEAWVRVLCCRGQFRSEDIDAGLSWFRKTVRGTSHVLDRESPLLREVRLAREKGVSCYSAEVQAGTDPLDSLETVSRLDGCTHDCRLSAGDRDQEKGDSLAAAEFQSEIRRAVDKLSRQQRDVLELITFHGLTVKAVAARLHLSAAQVAQRLCRARQRIYQLLPTDARGIVDSWRKTTRPSELENQGSTEPRNQETRRPGDQETRRPGDHGTTGPRDHGTREAQKHGNAEAWNPGSTQASARGSARAGKQLTALSARRACSDVPTTSLSFGSEQAGLFLEFSRLTGASALEFAAAA